MMWFVVQEDDSKKNGDKSIFWISYSQHIIISHPEQNPLNCKGVATLWLYGGGESPAVSGENKMKIGPH